MAGKKRLLTGIQSSGQLHIGNYFGALKPFVGMYEQYESMLMVADYHSLTSLKDPAKVRENIFNTVKDYVAAGVDPSKATIFKQSDVLEHMELAWIFDCLVTVPFLELSHAYKDKVAKGLEANAGLFTYPMLMAADILLYDTDIVPVGEDQRQHLEYAREAAAKFNNAYGQTFIEPKEMINKEVATIPGTDGKKMSKSYGNTIPLFGTKDEISKAVMSIVTDSGIDVEAENKMAFEDMAVREVSHATYQRPINLYRIQRLFRSENELADVYPKNQNNYKALKEMLIEDLEKMIAPMREKRASITDADVIAILKDGGVNAKQKAEVKMQDVRKKVGVSLN